MSITVVTTLHCEHEGGCKEVTSVVSATETKALPRQARKVGKSHGWSRVGGKDYCPDHKPTYKRVLVPSGA